MHRPTCENSAPGSSQLCGTRLSRSPSGGLNAAHPTSCVVRRSTQESYPESNERSPPRPCPPASFPPRDLRLEGMRQDALAETRHARTLCSTPPEALCANVQRCILNLVRHFTKPSLDAPHRTFSFLLPLFGTICVRVLHISSGALLAAATLPAEPARPATRRER